MKIEKTKEAYKTQLISSLKTKIASLSMLFLALSLFVQCTGSLNEAENNNNGLGGEAKGFFSSLLSSSSVDRDGNGLIEISSAEQLNNVRYNLTGTSWKTSASDVGSSEGCPNGVCRGYELAANIDFATTRWGSAYTGTDKVAGGWEPIGNVCGTNSGSNCTSGTFSATFEGNGFVIRNLYIKPSINYVNVGLFGIARGVSFNQMALEAVEISCTTCLFVGGLVGITAGIGNNSITNSYVTGSVSGSAVAGGLIGFLSDSNIIRNSYAIVSVKSSIQYVGGLVGYSNLATISNSYATGPVQTTGRTGRIGGLVGFQDAGNLTNSYATGRITAPTGSQAVGGLVGYRSPPTDITSSYWDQESTGITSGSDVLSHSTFQNPIGLSTNSMKSVSGDYPSNLGNCFKFVQGSYPRLYTWNGSSCTQTLLGGPNGLVDRDRNGLIEISSAEQLNNVRYNVTGTSYKTSASDVGSSLGCPNDACRGYELVANIDFATTKWGTSYTGADKVAEGWEPIGKACNIRAGCYKNMNVTFNATFEGNGFIIKNLYINRPTELGVGLFSGIGNTNSPAFINKVSLERVWVKGKSIVGSLAGEQHNSTIQNTYVTGFVTGVGISLDENRCALPAGGLIGWQVGSYPKKSFIRNSYSLVDVITSCSQVGGLVGNQTHYAYITNSYARGAVKGSYRVGGLVGFQDSLRPNQAENVDTSGVFNSYATGLLTANNFQKRGLLFYNVPNRGVSINSYWDMETTGALTSDGLDTRSFALTTAQMKSTTGNYPALLGSCFQFVQGKYPKLYTIENEVCTQTLLGGPNLD